MATLKLDDIISNTPESLIIDAAQLTADWHNEESIRFPQAWVTQLSLIEAEKLAASPRGIERDIEVIGLAVLFCETYRNARGMR